MQAGNKVSYIAKLWSSRYYRDSFIKYLLKSYITGDSYQIVFKRIIAKVTSAIESRADDISIVNIILDELSVYEKYVNGLRTGERSNTVAKFIDRQIESYLDYGCGDGSITKQIGRELNITEVYGVDVIEQEQSGLIYCLGNISCINDDSIDLVTAFVSFHHIPNIHDVLNEIHRVMKTGGVLVIREHDFDAVNYQKIQFKNYLHAIHVFNDVFHTGDCDIQKLESETNYKSSAEWTKILGSHGFKFTSELRYPGNNPQKLYHAGYVKI